LAGDEPLVVIGHSSGGIIARIRRRDRRERHREAPVQLEQHPHPLCPAMAARALVRSDIRDALSAYRVL
jgi:hypothetical protein